MRRSGSRQKLCKLDGSGKQQQHGRSHSLHEMQRSQLRTMIVSALVDEYEDALQAEGNLRTAHSQAMLDIVSSVPRCIVANVAITCYNNH